jgi:hypothetical protein
MPRVYRGLCPLCLRIIEAPEFWQDQKVELPCGCTQAGREVASVSDDDDVPF